MHYLSFLTLHRLIHERRWQIWRHPGRKGFFLMSHRNTLYRVTDANPDHHRRTLTLERTEIPQHYQQA